jgi:hypothetical protein
MMGKTLIGLLRATPFQPFQIRLHDGHDLDVTGVGRLARRPAQLCVGR